MNYFPFHIGDYASHTRNLSLLEDLAYRRLLDAYYLAERPFNGCLADVAREIGMRDYLTEVEYVLGKFFELCEDGWRNKRADREIAHFSDKKQKASEAGKASAQRRLNVRSTSVGNKATSVEEVATNVQPTNNQNQNQEPIVNSVAKATGGKPPLSPDEIIFGYGLPLLTSAGTPEKQARSFLGGLRKQHGDDSLIDKLRDCMKAKPLQPLEWLASALPPAGRRKPVESFAERDERIAREKWERMTGQVHPDNSVSLTVIEDVSIRRIA